MNIQMLLLTTAGILLFYMLLTCLIEGVVIGIIWRNRRYVKYSIACNVITNPLFNFYLCIIALCRQFSLLEIFELNWQVCFVCGEIIVVLIEAWIYYYILQRKLQRCFLMSLVANVCSAAGGLVIMW